MSSFRLTNVMLGLSDNEREITEMDQSALLEIGNIMMSAFLDAVATLLNIIMLPSPPQLTIDIPIAAVETIIASNAGEEDIDEVVLFKTELLSSEHEIDCNILLLPNHPMLGQLVTMLEDLMKPS